MKLKDLLTEIFRETTFKYEGHSENEYTLKWYVLAGFKNQILKTDEFKDVSELIILPKDGNEYDDFKLNLKTKLIKNDFKLTGNVYLYSIGLTSQIYNPKAIHNPIKDGCVITPLVYKPEDFMLYKKLVMEFNVESDYNESEYNSKLRNYLHSKLDDILNNPKEYEAKGQRGIVFRAFIDGEFIEDNTTIDSNFITL